MIVLERAEELILQIITEFLPVFSIVSSEYYQYLTEIGDEQIRLVTAALYFGIAALIFMALYLSA